MDAPETPKPPICPDCDVSMMHARQFGGIPLSEKPTDDFVLSKMFEVSLYTCPGCGLVRIYSANVLSGKRLGRSPQ